MLHVLYYRDEKKNELKEDEQSMGQAKRIMPSN